jgi:uncharacterized protein (DUF58 family)
MVRELEADTTQNTRLVLMGRGRAGAALEAGLSEAASLAVALIRAGAGVELAGPGCAVPLGHGRAHLRRLLAALALYDPESAAPAPVPVAEAYPSGRAVREIRVGLA